MTASPEIVLLAIQSALRLGGAMRTAYMDGTRDRALALPLPRAPGVKYDSAHAWFSRDRIGEKAAASHPHIQQLVALRAPSEAEQAELVELYRVLYAEYVPLAEGFEAVQGQLDGASLSALLSIRQWAKGQLEAPPTALQRVAGTLVNVAVDYFAHAPGAVSERRSEGRALLAFLRALDDVDFATTAVEDVADYLLIGVLDGVAAAPALASGGANEQILVQSVARTLAAAARERLAGAPTTERWDAAVWLQLAARALVKGGAEVALAEPARFLHVRDPAEANLVSRVGATVAELVIGSDSPSVKPLLSAPGLERVVQAALEAVSANPSLLGSGARFAALLSALAREVAALPGSLGPDLFPDLALLLLRESAEHAEALWPAGAAPERNLAFEAIRTALRTLARPPAAGDGWRPGFTRLQLLALLEVAVAQARDNPQWLRAAAGGSVPLAAALGAMLDALARVPRAQLDAGTVAAVLQAGLGAVAARRELLDGLPGRPVALTAALDAVFAALGSAPSWRLAPASVARGVAEAALAGLATWGSGARELEVLGRELARLAAATGPVDAAQFAAELGRQLAPAS